MIKKKLVETPPETDWKGFPYLRIKPLLEKLVEADVDKLESYLNNLKERQAHSKSPQKTNQRTKGQVLKAKQKAKKQEKKLEDEIQIARSLLLAESLTRTGGS